MTGTPPPADDAPDVVCLGESMVTFLPDRPGRLADVPSFARGIGGAESNVACALAAAGHRAKWVGRVGRDGFGDHLVEAIGAYGVDVGAVRRDPRRPTGVYFRTATDRASEAHEVVYYRAGSAASAMSPETVPYASVGDGRILHLSGITAALSEPCLALVRELTAPRAGRPLVSFDVNFRPGLWADAAEGGRLLLELARGADLVFVGADEAEAAWGVGEPEGIRALLPEPAVLVVKRGGEGAVVFERPLAAPPVPDPGTPLPDLRATTAGGAPGTAAAPPDLVVSVPAPRVDVVAPVGAGDAFAAGFLSGTLRGLGSVARVRHGHLMAAAALTVPGDLAVPPRRARADRLAGLDDAAWGRLHLGPGWTGDDQEVRTP
ncbi:sugar kinase [Streptomyces showdoensis]|uniref:Carbohydrate kinase n=1 Tax=Streptomyces showdoensis TaxID=68268 RepID=A0A2P2GJ78_STREW|nr:sugar kinase [Streptomyces showdoensis]KKZ71572.1 carbohydrate kinase [Streptomyces showdoensis]